MSYYVFNFSGDRVEAAALLRAKMWGMGGEEQHRDELAPGDRALIYVALERAFIGRAAVASAVHHWTRSEADAYPGVSRNGVVLSEVDEWDRVVSMDAVVQRIDPTASNPLVQANAAAGFRMALVQITGDEYEAALALSPDAHERTGSPTTAMQLTHVRLLVRNYRASFGFWRDVVGLRVEFGDETGTYASFDTGRARLSIFSAAEMAAVVGLRDGTGDSPDRFVIQLDVERVDHVAHRLAAKGVAVTDPTDQLASGIHVAHFRDPEGNLIELAEPLPERSASSDTPGR